MADLFISAAAINESADFDGRTLLGRREARKSLGLDTLVIKRLVIFTLNITRLVINLLVIFKLDNVLVRSYVGVTLNGINMSIVIYSRMKHINVI